MGNLSKDLLDQIREAETPPGTAEFSILHQAVGMIKSMEEGSRARRLGEHLMEKATQLGWKDDGEGAYEFVVRKAYEQGAEDQAKMNAGLT